MGLTASEIFARNDRVEDIARLACKKFGDGDYDKLTKSQKTTWRRNVRAVISSLNADDLELR